MDNRMNKNEIILYLQNETKLKRQKSYKTVRFRISFEKLMYTQLIERFRSNYLILVIYLLN